MKNDMPQSRRQPRPKRLPRAISRPRKQWYIARQKLSRRPRARLMRDRIAISLIHLEILVIRSFPDRPHRGAVRVWCMNFVPPGIDINRPALLISRWWKEISPIDTDKWRDLAGCIYIAVYPSLPQPLQICKFARVRLFARAIEWPRR